MKDQEHEGILNTRKEKGRNLPKLFYLNDVALQKMEDPPKAGGPPVIGLQEEIRAPGSCAGGNGFHHSLLRIGMKEPFRAAGEPVFHGNGCLKSR